MRSIRRRGQTIAGDGPGISTVGPVEIRVAAIPPPALAKLHDRKVPGDQHGNDFCSPGCKVKRTAMAPPNFSLSLTQTRRAVR